MYHNSINVIGIMSGTSLDGLDLCLVKFNDDDYSEFQIIKGLTYPYSKKWINKLTNSINLSNINLDLLDREYGKLISDHIKKFINKCGNPKIDLVSSHGHTVFHDPKNGQKAGPSNFILFLGFVRFLGLCAHDVVDLGSQNCFPDAVFRGFLAIGFRRVFCIW